MSNPYYNNGTGNLRSNVAGNSVNGPMKLPPANYYNATPGSMPSQQPGNYEQGYNAAQNPQANMRQPNQSPGPNLPPTTSGYNINGHPPMSGARNSPLQHGPPSHQGGYSPNHVQNSKTYSPQMTPPPPTYFPPTVNHPPGSMIPQGNVAPIANPHPPTMNHQQNYGPNSHHSLPPSQMSYSPGKGATANMMMPPSPNHGAVIPPSQGTLMAPHQGQGAMMPPPPGQSQMMPPPLGQGAMMPPPPLGQSAMMPPPLGQGAMMPPPSGQGAMMPPPSGQGTMMPPPLGQGAMMPPPSGQGAMMPPPSGQGAMMPPPSGQGTMMQPPPRQGGNMPPPPAQGTMMTSPPQNLSSMMPAPLSDQPNQPSIQNNSPYSQNNFNHMSPPTMMQQPPPGIHQMQRHPGQMLPPGIQQPSNLMPSGPGPTMPPNALGQYPYASMPGVTQGMTNLGINDKHRPIDILQEKRLLPLKKHHQKPVQFESGPGDRGLIPPKRKNCNTDVFRCTLNAIPQTQALLSKVKLPLGLIIHPFKDLSSLPVISAGTIVRCKRCRTYINPFVNFLDERRWRCNLCFVVNDIPEEFLHHPVTKTYGEPHTRPECTNATLEFIAPQEYMVRPPQPAVYMFLLDVSHSAVETGYLQIVCDALLDHLDHLPGDARTKIGFISYNGTVHFYKMVEGSSQPQMLVVSDLDDIFLPTPDDLLVNLRESKELVCDLLRQLPEIHEPPDNLSRGEVETQSALGAALLATQKMMAAYGGRVTVFQQSMPTAGPGSLKQRENPNSRAGESTTESLNPSTDFYKKLALDSSAHQVAMDFFFMNSQFIDIATLSCASRFSAGDLHYYPGLHVTHNPMQVERLSRDLDRYLTRKIGFEAVMRIRCTKGLAIHTFHGNFFVRSTDLLALANINPDAGYGLNLSIEESLTDLSSVSVQAALLYTSSKGERRIRVHTMCFPVAKNPLEIFNSVDSDAVVSLLSKMAVDRSITAKVSDARDALLNAVIDALRTYKETVNPNSVDNSLLVPPSMRTFPLVISCLLKHPAFRAGVSTRLDDRVFSMIELKMQPTSFALQSIHPDLYRVDNLSDENGLDVDERIVPQPQVLPLSAESIDRDGVYLLDSGWNMYLHVCATSSRDFLHNVLGVEQFSNIEQPMYTLPDLDNPQAETFHNFLEWLQDQRPHYAPMQVIRADSREHYFFMQHMRKDKTESSLSFQEFLQHVKQQMTK